MINLDYLCVKSGQEVGEEGDKAILQKALGVLREDGIYAMFLWLEDKDKNVRTKLISLLNEDNITKYLFQNGTEEFPKDFSKFCNKLTTVAQDVDKLLFLKKMLERSLTYALYHAKIKG